MRAWVLSALKWYRYTAGAAFTFFVLRMHVLILLFGNYTAYESNTVLLLFEIAALAFTFILQALPLPRKRTHS